VAAPSNLKPWKPGQSGNPRGRPKGFASKIREQTRNGEELVEFALEVWRDASKTLKERWPAFVWLSEYAYGKAPTFAPIEEGDPLELDGYDRAIREIVDELAARREAGAPGEAEARTVARKRKTRAATA
jgi:hypothetical protein